MKKLRILMVVLVLAGHGNAASSSDDNVDTLHLKSCKAQGFDKAGVPNEPGRDIALKLEDESTTKEEIYRYFSHYSPVIRHKAANAMVRHGEKAMPLLIEALQSGDRYRIRAACDTIGQFRGFFGVTVNLKKGRVPHVMATETNAKAVPYLAPLLDHEEMYVRMGALMALSRCGKAAAPHLEKAMTFLTDEDQWMRGAAVYVLHGVGSPEADKYLPTVAQAMLEEVHVQPLNIMSDALRDLISTCDDPQAVLAIIGDHCDEMFAAFHQSRGTAVLAAAGKEAQAQLPGLEKRIAALEAVVRRAEERGERLKNDEEWTLNDLKKTRDLILKDVAKGKK